MRQLGGIVVALLLAGGCSSGGDGDDGSGGSGGFTCPATIDGLFADCPSDDTVCTFGTGAPITECRCNASQSKWQCTEYGCPTSPPTAGSICGVLGLSCSYDSGSCECIDDPAMTGGLLWGCQ